MFDDHTPQPTGGLPPSNLPMKEPGDMFSAVDDIQTPPETFQPMQVDPVTANNEPSAVNAGVLTPKQPQQPIAPPIAPEPISMSAMAAPFTPPPMSTSPQQSTAATPQNFPTKGPGIAKMAMFIFLGIIGLAIVAGGVWFAYNSFAKKDTNQPTSETSDFNVDNTQTTEVDLTADIFATDNVTNTSDNSVTDLGATSTQPEITNEDIDNALIFGQLIDTDGDGLDDIREADLGTDPKNWDTDGDDLSDGDEVIIWKTQPLNPDTDDDGFKDGEEIKGGYNPVGPGRLFEAPTN